MAETLSRRALNRSFLARQLLLERASMTAADAIEHLVGMQAQSPAAPYVGLRARLDAFDPRELSTLIDKRKAVRIALMRSTIHLVTARDCLKLRPAMQPAVERPLTGNYGTQISGLDRRALLAAAETLFGTGPLTGIELERELAKRWKKRDAHALGMAVRCWLPLVQVPPRGLWGRSGPAAHTTVQEWLGKPLARSDRPERILLRYLRAFGPATPKDFQTWSGLTGAAEIIARLHGKLRTFRDENGAEMVDIPDHTFPDPNTPVPPLFLPEYDNALLSHADRTRVIEDGYRTRLFTKGGLLVDGFVVGRWWIATGPKKIRDLVIEAFEPIPKKDRAEVEEEGTRVLRFVAGDKAGEVRPA